MLLHIIEKDIQALYFHLLFLAKQFARNKNFKEMNSAQIIAEIQLRFKSIERYTGKLEFHFNKENIQSFREEVKSLRAFLDLLGYESAEPGDLKIRKRLKSFYGYTGIIHSILIHLHYVLGKYADESLIKQSPYITALQNEMNQWTKSAMDVLRDGRDFEDEENRIISAIPRKLGSKAIDRYITEKAQEFQSLLNEDPESEDTFHTLRTLIKNLIYLWKYIENQPKENLPVELFAPDRLKLLDDLLVMHQQYYVQLHYLQPPYINLATDQREQLMLQTALDELSSARELLRQQIMNELTLSEPEVVFASQCCTT
jgi:hypothetical protein